MNKKPRYVCGFLFQEDNNRVVLIEKLKPEWQRGKLNGVGGLIEPGETPEYAMAREFREETGIKTFDREWVLFAQIEFETAHVAFFKLFDPDNKLGKSQKTTDEQVIDFPVNVVEFSQRVIPNLKWLIQMALNERSVVYATQL